LTGYDLDCDLAHAVDHLTQVTHVKNDIEMAFMTDIIT